MGSEADVEAASTNAVDSDGSVSWEDFFGEYFYISSLSDLYIHSKVYL